MDDIKQEDIILQFNNVKYLKKDGQFCLTSTRFGWVMVDTEMFTINVPFSEIRTQKISAEGKPKVQLQLVLFEAISHTFHFCNPEGRERQLKERDQAKEKIAELKRAQSNRRETDELAEKKRILESNPLVKQLYLTLVTTNVMSPDDFWNNIAAKYKQDVRQKQDCGVMGSFLYDIKPQTDGSNGKVMYQLSPEIIQSVFTVYPGVQKQYQDYVPRQLSQSEFWTRFFQSHYYNIHTPSQTDALFMECAKYDDKEWNRELSTTVGDPFCSLEDLYEETPASVDNLLKHPLGKSGNNHIHMSMIRSYNQQSLNILKSQARFEAERTLEDSTLAQITNGASNGISDVPKFDMQRSKKARLEEKVTYDDLVSNHKVEAPSLTIHQREKYLAGPSNSTVTGEKIQPQQMANLGHQMSSILSAWHPDLPSSQNADVAYQTLQQFSELCRKGRVNAGFKTGGDLPRDIHEELSRIYSSARELLWHFWSCFPPKNAASQEKAHKMHALLCRFHETTVRPFQDKASKEYSRNINILEHLFEMFNNANTKYEAWNARLGR